MPKQRLTPRQINTQRKRDGLPPLNFKLLRRIIHKLETTPEAYDQSMWGRREAKAPCGTAACIAGWAAFLDRKLTLTQLHRNPKSAQRNARKSIGLGQAADWYSDDEATVLFTGDPWGTWPEPFSTRWWKAGDSARRQARVAIAYLKHIIETGKVLE